MGITVSCLVNYILEVYILEKFIYINNFLLKFIIYKVLLLSGVWPFQMQRGKYDFSADFFSTKSIQDIDSNKFGSLVSRSSDKNYFILICTGFVIFYHLSHFSLFSFPPPLFFMTTEHLLYLSHHPFIYPLYFFVFH